MVTLENLKTILRSNPQKTVWFFLVSYEFTQDEAVPQDLREFLIKEAEWFQNGKRVDYGEIEALTGPKIRVGRIVPRKGALP